MDKTELLEKLEQIRNSYTFPQDRRNVDLRIKAVKQAIVREEAGKLKAIEDLIDLLNEKIKDISLSLGWDSKLSEEQRKNLFTERDCYLWLSAFFTNPEEIIKNAEAMVGRELKNKEG